MHVTTFASALAYFLHRSGVEQTPAALRVHLREAGIEVTRQTCDNWLTGRVTPARDALPKLADSLKLEGADRLHFYELACAS